MQEKHNVIELEQFQSMGGDCYFECECVCVCVCVCARARVCVLFAFTYVYMCVFVLHEILGVHKILEMVARFC